MTDQHITKLKSAGYSEEQLFEITFAAAMGSAMPALENTFGVLYGMSA
ncbi:MAG: alkylhydroperoxidase/carboxymuconolactone decarboxylase family protein YurZ [Mariniblastus sp.]|jgi:alkylhydroperoxidase/carboxymuconolactone decarboxylase family protein YurZ